LNPARARPDESRAGAKSRRLSREIQALRCSSSASRRRWALWALPLWLLSGTALAQDAADRALERLEAIDVLRVGVLRPAGVLVLRPGAREQAGEVTGGVSLGFAAAALEKKGAAWEALRIDRLQILGDGVTELAYTLLDLQLVMLGKDQDDALCAASVPVFVLGDCIEGGVFGLRAQLLHQAHDFDSARWFHRYLELGAVLNLLGDSFDVDFVQRRLPLLFGVSLDHVANVDLPEGEHGLRLRGVAGLDALVRFADHRLELLAAGRYRPALAPFDAVDDFALEGNVRLSYLWLAPILGAIRATAQRVFLQLQIEHWSKPWLAESAAVASAPGASWQVMLGLELTARNLTPE
jgi:hypothetical protein